MSKGLEFIASKSSSILEKQIESYNRKQTNAGTIIGICALFIPFFLGGIKDSNTWIQYLSIFPVTILCLAIFLMLLILVAKPLSYGFNKEKFEDLANSKYEDVLLFEIGANQGSFENNNRTMNRTASRYNWAIGLTIFAIFFSATLLMINKFDQPSEKPIKIEIINPKQ